MTNFLLPQGRQQFLDNNGVPLAGGFVFTYEPGTSTPKSTLLTPEGPSNTNPVELDSSGSAILWGDGSYRLLVKDIDGVTIWDHESSVPSELDGSDGFTIIYLEYVIDGTPNAQIYEIPGATDFPIFEDTIQDGATIALVAGATNSGAMTIQLQDHLNVLLGDPEDVYKYDSAGATLLTGGEFIDGNLYQLIYSQFIGGWQLINYIDAAGSIPDGSITNAKLTTITGLKFKGHQDGGTGAVVDIPMDTATAMLDEYIAATGITDGIPGTVPPCPAGDEGKFLRGDATWQTPAGGGGGGAPDNATYLTASSDGTLSAERVVTDAYNGVWDFAVAGQVKYRRLETWQYALSNQVDPLVSAVGLLSVPVPYNLELTEVQAFVVTPAATGGPLTFDIRLNGTSIMSTLITIEDTENNSIDSATPPVIASPSLTRGGVLRFDLTDDADGTAVGAIITLIGYPNP